MITLITGGTGDGKTALAVKLMQTEYVGRPIFVMGIPDLKLDHTPTPPVEEWTEFRQAPEDPTLSLAYFTFPENAVIFLDEGQRIFRPRHPSAKVPPEVQAFETHRHCGIDFVIITQYPNLLDQNIRRLCKRHFHIHATPVGKYLLEWPCLGDPEDKGSREIATRNKYSPPKEVFGLYKSAEVHTKVKRRLPLYVYGFGAALLLTIGLAVKGYFIVQDKMQPAQAGVLEHAKTIGTAQTSSGEIKKTPDTPAEYVASLQPRIPGLHHTAPRYDDLTKPTDAPFPVACIHNHRSNVCRCVDQQGTNYQTTHEMCVSIVRNGVFKDWGNSGQAEQAQPVRLDQRTTSPKPPVTQPEAAPTAPEQSSA